MIMLKTRQAWSKTMSRRSAKEGWNLFVHDQVPPRMLLESLDQGDEFATDDEAASFVIKKALKGSKRHLLALYLDGRPADTMVDIQPPLASLVGKGVRERSVGMDPEANLQEQLQLAQSLIDAYEGGEDIDPEDIVRLSDLVLALNEWITKGRFLPTSWRKVGGK